ncbi:hypothetical protein IV203_027369 [Nitzschia inconspicua]|uniref:RRM domain-containing protein n=1 Tax=Nitzschia inconspicua TaxID=303405 RepID=A0A9K3LW56_9STRA|nr:hypothetical protein IV203_027369 [Nitzschia inconspicua]
MQESVMTTEDAAAIGERIYIGGLDPPRLTASDILQRLKSMEQIVEIQSIDDHRLDEKPYLHFQAICKDSDLRALDVIAKQYHNVKWKGCKLAVEAAKPHFLQRLEEERRRRVPENDRNLAEDDNHPVASAEPSSSLPRKLRVRKKYGQEAFHIDTKPWTVENWSDFSRARSKSLKRIEKHGRQEKALKQDPKAKLQKLTCRAIHFRFSTHVDNQSSYNCIHPDPNLEDTGNNIHSDLDSSTASSSDDSASISSSSTNAESVDQTPINSKRNTYQWSPSDDDDEDTEREVDNDDDDDDDDDESTSSKNQSSVLDLASSDRSIHLEPNNAEKEIRSERSTDIHPHSQESTYNWSSDDDNSNSEIYTQQQKQRKPLLEKESIVDEFAAALPDAFEAEERNLDEDSDTDPQYHDVGNADLDDDVNANLRVLSTLFPEMNSLQPVKVPPNGMEPASRTFQAAGIMPRFDPALESSKKYIVEENVFKTDVSNQDENELRSEDEQSANQSKDELSINHDSTHDGNEEQDTTLPAAENLSAIYEQDKLESVFRDARNAWDKHTPTQPMTPLESSPSTMEPSTSTGGFSFGFKLDDAPKQDVRNSSEPSSSSSAAAAGFSFSFNLPSDSAGHEKEVTDSADAPTQQRENKIHSSDETRNEQSFEDTSAVGRPPRLGLEFPREDLLQYVDNFFSLNNGQRIIHDPEGFRSDPQEREAWNQQRLVLTADWKRKRKYAMSRIQKRLRG